MKRFSLIVAGLLPAMLSLLWTVPVQAAATSAVVNVQATVRPWISFSANQSVSSYQVTEQDIRRGYLDLPRALTIRLQTNIPDDIRIDILNSGPELILVHGSGNTMAPKLTVAGGHPAAPLTQVLDMRIVLPADVAAGTYPLQVALAPQAY